MRNKRGIDNYAMYFIIGSIYALAVNMSILATTILDMHTADLFWLGLGFLVLFAVIFWNKITMLITLGVILITALILYRQWEYMEEFWYFINELILLTRGYIMFRPEFNLPLVVAICLLTGLFIAICLYVSFNFYLLAAFGSGIFIVGWIMEYNQSVLGFVLFLFCFCVLLVRKLQGSGKEGLRASLVVAPLCAVLVLISSSMPTPQTRIDNETIDRLLNEPMELVGEFFFLTFNPKYFSFQATGFGGHGGRLGGPVALNNRAVMAVDAPRRVYLSGATHNIYTGYSWISINRDFVPTTGRFHPSYIEFLETSNSLFRNTSRLEVVEVYDGFELQLISYMPIDHVDIYVGSNRMGTLFRPLRERGILFDNPALHHVMQTNPAGDRRLETLIPRNTMYRYHFLDLDYRDEHIQSILQASHRGLYRERLENPEPLKIEIISEEWPGWISIERYASGVYYVSLIRAAVVSAITGAYNVYQMEMTRDRVYRSNFTTTFRDLAGFDRLLSQFEPLSGGERIISELGEWPINQLIYLKTGIGQDQILFDYANFVRENYLALPVRLPERVIDLAHEITQGYESDYEKIRAIQEFLLQFRYTLTPDPIPPGRDFVDYFLFDGQEGYCIYYASAMVVLSRAVGVPARYVEGFLMPASRDPYTELFTVTNMNAHAWAEVYFEGFGWLIIEATPPYVFAMYERPFFAAPGAFDGWGFAGMDQEEYLRAMGLWYLIYGMEDYAWDWDFDGLMLQGLDRATGAQAQNQIGILELFAIMGISLISVIVLYFVGQGLFRFICKQRVKRMSPNARAIYYYREILRITSYWRYPVQKDETIYSYGQRIRYRFTFANESIYIRDLSQLYYKARYGAEPLTEEEAELMKDCYYELVEYVRHVRSVHKYFYIRYIRRVITL